MPPQSRLFANKHFQILNTIPNIKFIRQRTYYYKVREKNKVEYVIEFILINGVITETFKTQKERDKFHAYILESITKNKLKKEKKFRDTKKLKNKKIETLQVAR